MLIPKNTVRNCEQNWKKWRCYPIFGDIHFPHEVLRLCHEKTGFNAKWVTNWPTIVRDVDNYWHSKVRIDATKIWWHLITSDNMSKTILIYPDIFGQNDCSIFKNNPRFVPSSNLPSPGTFGRRISKVLRPHWELRPRSFPLHGPTSSVPHQSAWRSSPAWPVGTMDFFMRSF